ncbi:MAG: TRAP transporter small permease [Thermoleophilia bacterium]
MSRPSSKRAKGPSRLTRVIDLITTGMAWLAGILVLLLMVAIVYSVATRYLFNQPQPAVLEMSGYVLLYITFLGAPWLLHNEGHVRIDLLTNSLGPRSTRWFEVVTALAGAVVSSLLLWKGAEVTLDYYQREIRVMNILDTPQYLLLCAIPIGSFFLVIEFLRHVWKSAWSAPPVGDGHTSGA